MSKDKTKYNIICFSNQLWDFPNWTNKRHVMSRMAKAGHNVLFVDPPINLGRVFVRQILRGHWNFNRIITQLKKTPCGAYVYTPINLLPLGAITSWFHARRIRSLARKLFNSERKTLLWVYHVEMDNLPTYLSIISRDVLIYDCVDNYEGFPRYSTAEEKSKLRDKERYLASKAAVVFATAPGLVDKLKQYNENVHFTPNVGDYEKFFNVTKTIRELPEDLENIPRPRVGFAGALDEYKFDVDLMVKTAKENPHVSFVLIGQVALKDKSADLAGTSLEDLSNVHFLGQKPYETLEHYYAGFDGYIIPYRLNDYTVGGCFPVKFHDALAAGLPTVVTDLPAYLPFADVSYICKTFDEFATAVRKSLLEDSPDKVKSRQKVAEENNWDGKVEAMLNIVSSQV
jgi:glycosyltransferase involved in cell wall biosynthesis